MKQKILTLMAALLATLSGFSAKVKTYEVYVAGVQVTDENKNNITGPGITGADGAVKFDYESRTLILNDVTIKGEKPLVIDLPTVANIKVCGKVNLECTSASGNAVHYYNGLAVIGDHYGVSLNVKSAGNGFWIGDIYSKLSFDNLYLDITAEKVGIQSRLSDDNIVYFGNVSVKMNCKEAVIKNVSGIEFTLMKIKTPQNAAYDANVKGLAVNGQLVSGVFDAVWTSGITVAGISVDGDNMDNVTGPGITGGKIWYDPATKILEMENTSVKGDTAILYTKTNLLMKIVGTVNLESVKGSGIDKINVNYYDMDMEICGDGYETSVLNIKASGDGIHAFRNLLLSDLTLNIECEWVGLTSRMKSEPVLTVKNSVITVKNKRDVLTGFINMITEGCDVVKPLGTFFYNYGGVGALNLDATGMGVTNYLEIRPTYGIFVGETPVYEENASNVVGTGITGGKVSYDAAANILTLDNVTMDLQFKSKPRSVIAAVYSRNPGLQIDIKGNVNFTCKLVEGFRLAEDTRICGEPGSRLDVKSDVNSVHVTNADLKFDGINAAFEPGISGFMLRQEPNSSLTFKNSNVTINGGNGGKAIDIFKSLAFDGCKIVNPEGAQLSTDMSKMYLEYNGEPVNYVEIESDVKKYELYIAGIQVNDDNAANITGPGISGVVKYNPTNNTLTLKDATIKNSASNSSLIRATSNQILNILISGTVKLESENSNCFQVGGGYINITGAENNAKLDMTAKQYGFSLVASKLTLSDLTVNINGYYGFFGNTGFGKVNIKNSNVDINTVGACTEQIREFVLEGCKITSPAGAAYDATLKGVALNGELVTGALKIVSENSGVEGVIADDAEDLNAPMFNIMGQQIKQPYNGQFYIQNGRKKVWRE